DDRDRHVHLEVVALAPEHRRVGDARDHVQVARRATPSPGLALGGQPHAAAVLHARRDVHAVALHLHGLAAPLARRAGILDLGAGAAALGARLGDREQPLALRLDAAALAARAHRRARARLGARAVTGRA